MNIFIAKNGIEITVGSIVRTKGSTIERVVISIDDDGYDGKHIHTRRVDENLQGDTFWHKPQALEVIV